MKKLSDIEFFTFENEVWYKEDDTTTTKLTEKSTEIIAFMIDHIENFYPDAYKALAAEYSKCHPNLNYFRYKIVNRFCKCNFGNIDNRNDIDSKGHFHFECVSCPLRGECKNENVICRPRFNHRISPAEMRVLALWYDGMTKEEIATKLYLSPCTIANHIANAFLRLDIHSKSEFIKYAEQNNLFDR